MPKGAWIAAIPVMVVGWHAAGIALEPVLDAFRSNSGEFAVEIDPEKVGREKVAAFAEVSREVMDAAQGGLSDPREFMADLKAIVADNPEISVAEYVGMIREARENPEFRERLEARGAEAFGLPDGDLQGL